MKKIFLALLLGGHCLAAEKAPAPAKPNILLVLVDDMGFSDLGSYGSEIETPNLDRLAREGLRLTQCYNTAKCHSSRVSLLSGRWCRQAADESLTRAVTIPEVLGKAGYFTAMTGKWHLDKQPEDFGFERFFGHLSGATNYYKGDSSFRLNGQPWKVPEKGFYTTVANVDYALKFLGEARETNKPWFLYVAFNAPHGPLQPLEADYKKYLGKYDAGWDVMRSARVAKQNELGLFDKGVDPSTRPDHIPAWDSLAPEMKSWEARRMAAYAALIDRIDQEMGRLLDDLKKNGELDNTLILFFSDNGACPYDRRTIGHDQEPYNPDTTWSDSTGWAWARNTPFRFYKQNQFEGGIATPAIVHWPAGLKTKPGSLSASPSHLVDVLPTLAEVGGAKIPETWPGREPTPLAGISLTPLFAGKDIKDRPPIHLLFGSNRGLRDGDWKLVSFESEPWELYNIAQDRTELHNVAAEHPDIVSRMAKQWTDMAKDVLHAPEKEYKPVSATATDPRKNSQWTDYSSVDASAGRHDAGKQKKAEKKAEKKVEKNEELRPAAGMGIRARAGTALAFEGDELVLTGSGSETGLSIDRVSKLPSGGPYQLVFSVRSPSAGSGQIFWTTDPQTKLPKGTRQAFDVRNGGEWQQFSLKLETPEKLYGFRLDPCSAPGELRIKGLKLEDASGKVLESWPASTR